MKHEKKCNSIEQYLKFFDSQSKRVFDAVLEKEYVIRILISHLVTNISHRHEKQAAQVFSGAFTWDAFFDAAADIYNGVSSTKTFS